MDLAVYEDNEDVRGETFLVLVRIVDEAPSSRRKTASFPGMESNPGAFRPPLDATDVAKRKSEQAGRCALTAKQVPVK